MCLQQEVVQEAQAPEGAPCEAQSQHHHLQEAHAPESAPCEDGAESQHHFQGLKFSDFATSKLQHSQKKRRQPLACQVEAIRQTLWSALGQLRLLRPSRHAKARFAFRRIPDHTEVFVDRCQSKRRSRPTEQGESVNTLLEPSIAEPESDEYVFVGSEMPDCQTRPDCQVRMKYLQKLSKERVWLQKAQRPASHQTIIIFDWDDTLLCTSFLKACAPGQEPSNLKDSLRKLEKAAISLLRQALSFGQTFIITNAVSGWVEQSAAEHLPELLPVLQHVRVLSARSRYESEYPYDIDRWKTETFFEVQSQLDSQVVTNIVSLGDSHLEMTATLAMGKRFENAVTKTVKFRERPSPEELLKQQKVVCKDFGWIVGHARDLSLQTSNGK
mmetsp:Transcript_133763/g.235891  ORF Transcript_133763/g.235891 Transcript_133763/m.235891 type:complete len:385 (+) Transcript_133763:68-1222(+)